MNPTVSRKLDSSSVAMRLGMCAAALAGTAATVSDANATIVTFTTPISVPNNIDGVYINFLTGVSATTAAAVAGWDFDPYATSTGLAFFWNQTPALSSGGVATAATGGTYTSLAPGAVISSASIFSQSAQPAASTAFIAAGTHTLGMSFYNETTAKINYGYVTITSGATLGFPATINSWSFDNTGAAITIPSVPEPESLALFSMGALALGAMNLRRLRKERRNQAH